MTEAEAYLELGVATAMTAGVGNTPACAICGSTSFHREDGVTRWETMEEAMPHLLAGMRDQIRTRELLTRTADRN